MWLPSAQALRGRGLTCVRAPAQFERYGDVGKLVLSNFRRFCASKKPTDDVFNKLTVRWHHQRVGRGTPWCDSHLCLMCGSRRR